ncbi:hypothetical protein RQM59_05055 [Flavobacteriaceae bacterium S356]|uniref:Tetratricopeptide repeat protein n=1 Tax=Asprobacillus argus TaxID=3076534 RepID=A0ABU3LEL2_9FLAO|nr:hypothetical protein [Flavobacteriaceae bacterium S356]
MTELNDIIRTLSSDEQKQFVLFLEKKNKRKDTKNIQLFQLILQEELSINEMSQKIYKTTNKDALYALRKRLYQSVIDFTANHSLEDEGSIDMQIIKYLLAARNYLTKGHYRMGYRVLDKAEPIAKEHQLYPLLNEIYHTKIQYAYKSTDLDIEALIDKFKRNQELHNLDEELNIAYAKIRRKIKEILHNGVIVDFQHLVENTFKEHQINLEEALSFKSLYQLITINSLSAFATKDYLKIENFLLSKYEIVKDHKSKEKQLYYHIYVLYHIANTLFRNKKFSESSKYLAVMHEHMLLKKGKYYSSFKVKYYLLLGLNKNYSNQSSEAIKIFEPFVSKKHPDLSSLLDIYLSLTMCYFQQGEFKKAMRLFSKFYHTDKWYIEKTGKEWTMKKNLIEILLHLELENLELLESRLLSFKRSYYQHLKAIGQERAIIYLSFIEAYYKDPSNVTSTQFKSKVESSFEWITSKEEDIFVMSFYAWLKSKMEKAPLYETTLNLIQQ